MSVDYEAVVKLHYMSRQEQTIWDFMRNRRYN